MTRYTVNPLGYFCAPNAATPDYVASRRIEDFIAYGFVASYLEVDYNVSAGLTITDEDIQWLREGFLRCVEVATEFLPEMEKGQHADIDMGGHGTGVTLYPKSYDLEAPRNQGSPPREALDIQWRVELRDIDGAICLVQAWHNGDGSGGDDLAIWIDSRCLNNRFRVARAIARARLVNGLQCVIGELDRRLAAA